MNELTVTGKDLDAAVEQLWLDIFELVVAVKEGLGDYAIADAKEHISMQIIEYGNLCHLRGEQSIKKKENN